MIALIISCQQMTGRFAKIEWGTGTDILTRMLIMQIDKKKERKSFFYMGFIYKIY